MLYFGMTRRAKAKVLDLVAVTDVVGMVRGSSRDCWDEGTMSSSAEGVAGVFVSTSMGIVMHSSRDCCDDGTTSSSRGDDGVAEVPISSSTEVVRSCCDEGAANSYPDPPSDRMISGTPSSDSRRDRVEVLVPRGL